ncbi:hypothetical protein IV38_GL001488 [Lactobacillus selangorensis]|uniref:Phage shock protein PspC N-terminal domain-containing protein n=1 Tax=Lactobacillus selangorensis TaxID=81857 RepID=A0A0R2FL09_9LACO|nr:PspC domain-containing protein [Lactobacillus selangorensis]KRN28486.1 hypothetical protein IV38_GL001488 [Lactobacillus selangorensis]KRN31986.1 hypothetical protein IV40_GL001274 [Lactobacillus selangorensis]
MNQQPKRLTKSNNKVLSGVLGGIADYFNIDPTIVRVIFVLISFFTTVFPGILIYIILAIVMPDAPSNNSTTFEEHDNHSDWGDF